MAVYPAAVDQAGWGLALPQPHAAACLAHELAEWSVGRSWRRLAWVARTVERRWWCRRGGEARNRWGERRQGVRHRRIGLVEWGRWRFHAVRWDPLCERRASPTLSQPHASRLTPEMMLGRRQLARAVGVTRPTSATCVEGRCAGEVGVSGGHATDHERLHYAASEPFPRPVPQRVGVVGAGMSGLTTALALQLEGHRVSHVVSGRLRGRPQARIAQPPPARTRR